MKKDKEFTFTKLEENGRLFFHASSIFVKYMFLVIISFGALSSLLLLYNLFPEVYNNISPALHMILIVLWYGTWLSFIVAAILLYVNLFIKIFKKGKEKQNNLFEKRKQKLVKAIVKELKKK